jgi:hypothetical protein
MRFFHELGLATLERWRRADFDELAFPAIAASMLTESPPSAHVDPIDVVRWVHEATVLVPQVDLDASFGQPPLTVFHCERFRIDVLFWIDGTTHLHHHAFAGAFHVMAGSSIHSSYRFTPRHRYCERLLSGTLDLLGVELLTKGESRPIRAGPDFVHALFHCERPSVSVVVRTHSQPSAQPQYEYTRAGLAFDPFARSESATRKIQTLDLLQAISHSELESIARETVRKADAFLVFQILRHLRGIFASRERYVEFAESIRPAHAELIGEILDDVEERRDKLIASRRAGVVQADLRFCLALLLNVPDRPRILAMVRQAFPDREPIDTVVGWLAELSRLDAIHAWATSVAKGPPGAHAAGVLDTPYDQTTLRVVRHLLAGLSDEAVVERLGAGASPSEAESSRVAQRLEALRRSILLRPLFQA